MKKVFYGNNVRDDIGNRLPKNGNKILSDDAGNLIDFSKIPKNIPDNFGNSIDNITMYQSNRISNRKKKFPERQFKNLKHSADILNSSPEISKCVDDVDVINDSSDGLLKDGLFVQGLSQSVKKTDRRLLKFFELDDDDRIEYILTSTPEEKRAHAEMIVREIFEAANVPAKIIASVEESGIKNIVIVKVNTFLLKANELPIAVLNFLINKIVNRIPGNRIKLRVQVDSQI